MTVDLYRFNGAAPASLPAEARTASGELRTDLANQPKSRAELGFVYFATIDPATQHVVKRGSSYRVETLPAQPVPEPPALQPRVLGKLEFTSLAQAAGGMTDGMLVAAYKDPRFEAFWIKMQLASEVVRDHPVTTQALRGLEAAGYLPKGAAAVLSSWPVA